MAKGNTDPMADRLPPISPGEMLREEFLEPYGITPYRLAKEIGVPATRIHEILSGKRALTADTALRLGRFFGNSPQQWMNMQSRYELELARENKLGIEEIRPFAWPAISEESSDDEKSTLAA
jgi:addiction module HigA family antidote